MTQCNIIQIMLTILECKKILNKGERKYTDEEIKMIREFLYTVAEIENENKRNNTDKK